MRKSCRHLAQSCELFLLNQMTVGLARTPRENAQQEFPQWRTFRNQFPDALSAYAQQPGWSIGLKIERGRIFSQQTQIAAESAATMKREQLLRVANFSDYSNATFEHDE